MIAVAIPIPISDSIAITGSRAFPVPIAIPIVGAVSAFHAMAPVSFFAIASSMWFSN
jgi:hypothetical protein